MSFLNFLSSKTLKESEDKKNAEKEFITIKNADKLKEYIIDACTEMKISIRSIEIEENIMHVIYNYGKEAPPFYRNDKEELYKDIVKDVKDILDEEGYKSNKPMRSNVSADIARVMFSISEK